VNTSTPNTQPPLQHQETKTQEDQQQDSEDEIEAIIEDELVCLRQENERLRLMKEQLARRKAMVKRTETMQQQIEQERASQVVTSQRFVSCNQTLIMDIIKDLNQFGINSIKFTSNSKIRSEFDFSFEFCWPLVKVFNTKIVPNKPLYLKKILILF
jgi:hypothetical protein